MKCFERLLLRHFKTLLPQNFDPHQFAYRQNRSTEDAISTALHSALEHLELPGMYVRMLFVDYSSAFNTISPDILVEKLANLDFPPLICSWTKDFLTNRPQAVKVGQFSSSTLSLSTGSPPGLCAEPLPICPLHTRLCPHPPLKLHHQVR